MTQEELRKEKERLIKADIKSYENRARHVFNQGYELGYQQHGKDFIEKGEKAYQRGLEDSWDASRKIVLDGDDGLNLDELYSIFGDCDQYRILEAFSASEAIEKIREYEKKQKEARSGYVSFVGEKPQEQGVTTVFPESPCDLCRFKGLGDGKPCTMCPAEGKVEE